MKCSGQITRLLTMTAVVVLSSPAAHAQGQSYDPVIPRGFTDQRVGPSGELASPLAATRPTQIVQKTLRSRNDADARHCLGQASNQGVHRCAERYRSSASRVAAVQNVSAKPPIGVARRSVETSRSADVVKPQFPASADAAKAAELVKPMDVSKPSVTPRPVESTAQTAEPMKPAALPSAAGKTQSVESARK